MAEAVAVVSLVATIGTLIDLSTRLMKRLIEYQRSVQSLPKTFKGLETKLPLILNTLKRISTHAKNGGVDEETKLLLEPIVHSCLVRIEALDEILAKIAPNPNDCVFERSIKATLSLRHEKEIEKLMKDITEYLAILTLHSAAFATQLAQTQKVDKPVFMLPYPRDTAYLDRPDISLAIATVLQSERFVTLCGTGGVGKSQIAIEYCYRFQNLHPNGHIFWVHVGTLERALGDWNQMARKLAIPGFEKPNADVLQLAKDYLSEEAHDPWLLILDNADDRDVFFKAQETQTNGTANKLAGHSPHNSKGTTLVTTRDRSLGESLCSKRATISVTPLATAGALILLRSKLSGNDWDEANGLELVQELDCIPLAITQAAAFISHNNIGMSEYLGILAEEARDLLHEEIWDSRRDQDMQLPVLRTWRLSFDLVQKQNPRAVEILAMIAVIDRQGIPKSLL